MEVKGIKKFFGLFGIFFLILLYPVFGKVMDLKFSSEGVTVEVESPEIDLQTIMNGSYQNEAEKFLLENISGRNFMVRMHSQLMYSLFSVSPNSNIVIGNNKQLFEPEYLIYSLNIDGQPSDDEVNVLVDKLQNLQRILEENEKQLYIFITPSKARYYLEDAPRYYKYCAQEGDELAYDKFIRMLEDTDLNVFDSIEYIDAHRDSFEFPLWYSTGIHWSRALGSNVAEAFNEYLRQESGYDLGQIHVTNQKTSECLHPDADLYTVLNLLLPSKEEYYDVAIHVEEGQDKPNVFLRGGSFMGQSMNWLISSHIFNEDIYFENNYYFTDSFSSVSYLSNFDAYNELDVMAYLKQSDILILEVNEQKIYTMSWGFIDYILDNYISEER